MTITLHKFVVGFFHRTTWASKIDFTYFNTNALLKTEIARQLN